MKTTYPPSPKIKFFIFSGLYYTPKKSRISTTYGLKSRKVFGFYRNFFYTDIVNTKIFEPKMISNDFCVGDWINSDESFEG